MESGQYIKIVSAVVVFNNKILLLQRDYNAGIKDPGCWQLPGGGVEENETPDEAIRRELKEEIGIVPSSLRFLISPSADVCVYYARLTEEEVKNIKKGTEGKDLRFFSFEELASLPLTTKLKETINLHGETLKSLLV
jgi:8-oxo-dGTP diphosphatase